jgi:hypothetical protein
VVPHIFIFIQYFPHLPLTLRGGHRLRELENTVLRKVFGPKRDEVTGGWKK